MTKSSRYADVLFGIGYLLAAVAIVVVATMAYNRVFVSSVPVKLDTGSLGNAMQKGSDVKLHGVPVGKVTSVKAAENGAVLGLALDPKTSKKLSPDTKARLLPKTLFGERYVALINPEDQPSSGLSSGDTISQDTSDEAIELQDVFDQLLPLLNSIQPQKLAAMMGELSTMLRGEGEKIGDTLEAWGDYLHKLNPEIPALTEDISKLASVAETYNIAAPDLLSALDSMTTTLQTVSGRQTQLKDLYASVIKGSNTTTGWVSDNQNTIEVLSEKSRKALEAVRPYASQFPCLFESARKFIPTMDKNLGKGTDEPGLHVQLNVVKARGKYLPGKDTPKYSSGGKPRCPYVTGQTGTAPASAKAPAKAPAKSGPDASPASIAAPPSRFLQDKVDAGTGLGTANSPAENEMLSELLAPTQGMAPADYPQWSSLLVGPMLRNTKVTLK